jgi:hypothetical protein
MDPEISGASIVYCYAVSLVRKNIRSSNLWCSLEEYKGMDGCTSDPTHLPEDKTANEASEDNSRMVSSAEVSFS